ncbi:hypothetical protein ABBQ38_005962 [Trebouxia sp. C0009 RCD-2024]
MDAVNATEASINARDVGEQVLKYFWDLASLDENARSTAAEGLVAELKASQANLDSSNATNSKQPSQSPSLVYGLKRLVRGLGSGRQGARQGYALALGKLLSDVPEHTLPVDQVLKVMSSELDVSGQAKGTEAHDQMLGKVFGFAAIVRCKRAIDQETATKCAEGLIQIANKKSFLRELAANVLLDLTDKVEPEILAHILNTESCGLKAWLSAAPADSHPEVLIALTEFAPVRTWFADMHGHVLGLLAAKALLLALHLWPSLPQSLLRNIKLLPAGAEPPPTGYFTNPDAPTDLAGPAAAAFFAEKHLQKLLPVLRASSGSHPRLHSVWPTILALLLPGFTAVKDVDAVKEAARQQAKAKGIAGPGQLEALWRVVAHDLLASSHERKSLAFQLFTILLPNLQADQVPVVFSRAFLRCFSNNLFSSKTYLHSSAQRIAQRLIVFAGKARTIPGMQIALAVALQGVGGLGFDRLTHTNTVTKLLQNLDASSLEVYIQQLQEQFAKGHKHDNTAEGDQDVDKARQRVVEQLCSIAAIKSVPASIKTQILKFLAVNSFFAVSSSAVGKGKPKELKAALQTQPPPSAPLRLMCSARLLALIDSTTKAAAAQASTPADSKHKSKSKKRKAAELAEPAEVADQVEAPAAAEAAAAAAGQARMESPFLAEVVSFVSKVQRSAGVALAVELSEDVDEALSKLRESEALAATKLAAAAPGSQGQQLRAMLGLMRWLQLYILADPAATQPDVAVDLEGVFKGAFGKGKPAADEPHWMDVLVDILLSLLVRAGDALPFAPLREACETLFRAFADQVTSQGFRDMIRVVQQAAAGQDDEEEDDDMFEGEGAGDKEAADSAAAAAGDASADSSDASDDDDDEEEGDEDVDGAAVAAALDGSDGSGTSDEEDFDDDQMFQMDDKIAAALKVMARGGANAKESQEAILSFKFRVIGLLEIYVPNSPVLPTALPALLAALTAACQQGGDAALANRLKAMLTAMTKAKAEAATASPTGAATVPQGEAMTALLRRTLYLASRHKDKKVTAAAATAFAYLLRSSTTAEGLPMPEATAALKSALDDFFGKKKSKLRRKLFEELMSRAPLLKGIMLPALVQHTKAARSGYVKADGIALLLAFLRSCANKGQQSVTSVADAFRSHVPLIAELAVASISGDVGQSARQVEALKDICACFEQLPKVYPQDSLQGLMGKQNLQLVLQSATQAHDLAKGKVDAQLKRLQRLLTEKDSSVAFAQHVKPISNKKAKKEEAAAKKAMREEAAATSGAVIKKKKKKVKKVKGLKGKAAVGGAPKPKIKKNKDKYNKKKLASSKAAK